MSDANGKLNSFDIIKKQNIHKDRLQPVTLSNMDLMVRLMTYIWEIPKTNVTQDTDHHDRGFSWLYLAITGIGHQIMP
jgi:hypothetical protein